MEILIELIVRFLKSLFGEQEKPADMPPTRRPAPRQERSRGPYIYGDEGTPKTLEEILEEARRKAQQRGGSAGGGGGAGGARPAPSTQVRPAADRPSAAKPARRVLQDAPDAPSDPGAEKPFIPMTGTRLPTLAETEERRPSDAFEWATKRQTQEPQRTAESPRKPSRAMDESPSQSTLPAAREAIVARPTVETVRTIAAPSRTSAVSAFDIINALRAASPSQKAAVARQAMVMFEVFGPPRALRPHRTSRIGARGPGSPDASGLPVSAR